MDNTPTTPRAGWSVDEFCTRYGISKGMVFVLMRQKKIERLKIGRRTIIPVESADAWWASLKTSANAPSGD